MPHEFKITRRVEFSETDMAGIGPYPNFFRYMEFGEQHIFRLIPAGCARKCCIQQITKRQCITFWRSLRVIVNSSATVFNVLSYGLKLVPEPQREEQRLI